MESEKEYKIFTDLDVWKAARKYKNAIYALVKSFPSEERYRLTDQLVRASRSIGSNISEGYGRYNTRTRFIYVYKLAVL